jgi:acyl-CoA synthetase (NDP forming)
MYRYAQYRMRDEGEVRTFRVDKAAAQSILTKARGEGRLLLGEEEASALLEAYGIRTAKARVVRRIEDLASAAAQIGYPVVLKAIGPQLIHKSELQAVRVDLRGERELAEAASQMTDHLRQVRIAIEGFLLQEFVQGGMEVVLGMSRDKVYGPFLVFGLGGVYVEYLKDVAFGLPPLTDRDAMRMIESIRTYPMLRGVRGQPPRDLAALQDAILRLGALVADFDVLQEMDLNPILALEEGRGYRAVDARILLAPPSSPMPAIDPGIRAT